MSRVILGIDPGLTRCGVSVVRSSSSRKVSLVHVDTLRSDPNTELSARLAEIADGIEVLIAKHKPQVIAIERVFAQANLRSVMGVAQISGIVLYLANKNSIPVEMHTPSEVKAAVTGSGRAAKAQIGLAVTKILGLTEVPKPADAADAVAIAICNAWKNSSTQINDKALTSAQAAWIAAERVASRKAKR